MAKVEGLSSFPFCVIKCFWWVWWAWIETRAVCNECREKLFHWEEKPALEQLPSMVVPSLFFETQLNKSLRDLSCPYSWPCVQQEDGLWVLPNTNYHVILWACESLLYGNVLEVSLSEGLTQGTCKDLKEKHRQNTLGWSQGVVTGKKTVCVREEPFLPFHGYSCLPFKLQKTFPCRQGRECPKSVT